MVKIGGQAMYLWRAVDDEGEVLDMLVQKRRNKGAALRLLRKLLKNQRVHPEKIVTDGLASYAPRPENSAARIATGQADCGTTIGPRTHTCRSGDGSANSRSSAPRAQPRGSSPPMLPSTTFSMSSAT